MIIQGHQPDGGMRMLPFQVRPMSRNLTGQRSPSSVSYNGDVISLDVDGSKLYVVMVW